MQMTLFEVGKKTMFSQFIEHPADSIDVNLTYIFGVNQDVIQINNYENVKFFGQNFIDITLKAG